MTKAIAKTEAAKTTKAPAKAKAGKATAVASPNIKPVAPATNKTPAAAKAPAKPRTRKPAAAKVDTTSATVAPVVEAVKVEPVTPVAPVAAVAPAKRGRGRPISTEAVKVRRRVLGAFAKLVAAGEIEVTVKATAKAVKLKKVTVSNTIRWAESEGIIVRLGYKLKTGPGRKEVFYKLDPTKLAEAVAA